MVFLGLNNYRRLTVVLVALLFPMLLSACGTRAPHLNPEVIDSEPESGEKEVVVEIKPVDTSGFGNTERERLGIDLSAYFTAIEVKIKNNTQRDVQVDGLKAKLIDDSGLSYLALSLEESLNVFDSNDFRRGRNVQFPESDETALEMAGRIRELHLGSGEIPDRGSMEGIIFFQKIPEDECDSVSFVLNGIWISGEKSAEKFQFGLSCPSD